MREEADIGASDGKRLQDRGGPSGHDGGASSSGGAASMETQIAEERRRAAWAGAAEQYESTAELWTSQAAARMIGLAEISPRCELLDLGCGAGGLAIAAQTLGALVTAYDIAPSMIAAAGARPGGRAVEFRIGDIRALQDRAAGFDVATANFSFAETGEPAAALREAHRALKPDGRLLWSFWMAPAGGALFEVVDAARLAAEGIGSRGPASRGLDVDEAIAMTREAGFEAVEAVTLPLIGPADAATALEAVEKLDAATPSTRARSQTLAALEEALTGSRRLRAEAVLIIAQKNEGPDSARIVDGAATGFAPDDAASIGRAAGEASASSAVDGGAAEPRADGGLIGAFRRWLRRR